MVNDSDAIVASWGHDWRSGLPVRIPSEQAALHAEARRAAAALQEAARLGAPAGRALHRTSLIESATAVFLVAPSVPTRLQIGPFLPNASYQASIRLSSAFPVARSDEVPDQRGLGVHIVDHERRLDLLGTTGEAHHARDAKAMIASLDAAAKAVRGGLGGRLGALGTLIGAVGVRDALRLTKTLARAAQAGVSLAAMTFFSRAPFQLGEFAVRYRFAPDGDVDPAVHGGGDDALAVDFKKRLAHGPVRWSFDVQGYLDSARTPMDDHRVVWQSPWLSLGRLTVGSVETLGAFALRHAPTWPASNGPVLEPHGDLNMLRGAAYEASQRGR